MRIYFIHSLNNYSGSPNVLKNVILGLKDKGYTISLITSRSEGFLSNLDIDYVYTNYKWRKSKIITLFSFLLSQLIVFFYILFRKNDNSIYYTNTVLPFGAIIACRLRRFKVIYHIHEDINQKKALYYISKFFYNKFNEQTIFVSKYLKDVTLKVKKYKVIYNCLNPEFVSIANSKSNRIESQSNDILMIASLKWYKGVFQFIKLAGFLPEYNFRLVLNASNSELDQFISSNYIPANVCIHPTQVDVHEFYRKAKILLNLSDPKGWIETFGMTILEGFSYGLPAIVPTIGGPVELVKNDITGYCIDCNEFDEISEKIRILMEDANVYCRISMNAIEFSKEFNYSHFINEVENFILKS